MMEAVSTSEALVYFFHTSHRNIPEGFIFGVRADYIPGI
jgi:hypothetical protein